MIDLEILCSLIRDLIHFGTCRYIEVNFYNYLMMMNVWKNMSCIKNLFFDNIQPVVFK